MAENKNKRPPKGILKSSSSFEKPDAPKKKPKETKWDEMNILATLHPPDKDYGHMKIQEPKTPYNYSETDLSEEEVDGVNAEVLSEKLLAASSANPPRRLQDDSDSEEEVEEEEEEETEEQQAIRTAFETKRKAHYNEYAAVKLARKLIAADEDVMDEESTEGGSAIHKDKESKLSVKSGEPECSRPHTKKAESDEDIKKSDSSDESL